MTFCPPCFAQSTSPSPQVGGERLPGSTRGSGSCTLLLGWRPPTPPQGPGHRLGSLALDLFGSRDASVPAPGWPIRQPSLFSRANGFGAVLVVQVLLAPFAPLAPGHRTNPPHAHPPSLVLPPTGRVHTLPTPRCTAGTGRHASPKTTTAEKVAQTTDIRFRAAFGGDASIREAQPFPEQQHAHTHRPRCVSCPGPGGGGGGMPCRRGCRV